MYRCLSSPAQFLSGNQHFCKSALQQYTQHDFIALMEKHGIAYHEKKLGQLFCDNSAQDVIDMLIGECAVVGAKIASEVSVSSVKEGAAGGHGRGGHDVHHNREGIVWNGRQPAPQPSLAAPAVEAPLGRHHERQQVADDQQGGEPGVGQPQLLEGIAGDEQRRQP